MAEQDGPEAVYWLDKGYGCAVVGSLPREQLAVGGQERLRPASGWPGQLKPFSMPRLSKQDPFKALRVARCRNCHNSALFEVR